MDLVGFRAQLARLIEEAVRVAPSIERFAETSNYGNVTDENLDRDSVLRWEIESKTVLRQLDALKIPGAAGLLGEYLDVEGQSHKWHSRSIRVNRFRQILISAQQLLDSPLVREALSRLASPSPRLDVQKGYAFVAMPMDPEDHSLVDVLEAVKEAARRCQIHAERVDEPQSTERITDRILTSIQRAEFVIVDLTHTRPNVLFEAGFAHGLGKVPKYLARHGTSLEFDLKDYPVIFYRNLKQLKDQLEQRIRGLQQRTET